MSWLSALKGIARRARFRMLKEQIIRFAYEGARIGRRTSGWLASANSANAEIAPDLPRLRERSRELIRNNHFAAKAALEWVTKTVGTGILPRHIGDVSLDQRVTDLWNAFARKCSADGLPHFPAIQALVARTVFESGECLVRLRVRDARDRLPVPLQLQVLEPDFLDLNKTGPVRRPDGGEAGYIIQGVEFDLVGRRVAYWLFPQHPGEVTLTNFSRPTLTSMRVPSDQILHIYDVNLIRPGQVRGVPRLAPVMLTMRDLDDWEMVELVRKRTEACLAAFIKTPDGQQFALTAQTSDADGKPVETFEPGMVVRLKPGEEIEFNTPQYAGGYREYKSSRVHDLAAGIGMPYEILTGDLSQVNYSSYRAGLLGFRDAVEAFQYNVLIPQLCEPVYAAVMNAAVIAGLLPDGDFSCEWTPPAFDLLDREAEAKADELMLRIGTMTWDQAVSRQGYDPRRQIAEIAARRPQLDAAGVAFTKGTNGTDQTTNPAA
jgi:lambda family phage portal protein